jgi:hypothetical protein
LSRYEYDEITLAAWITGNGPVFGSIDETGGEEDNSYSGYLMGKTSRIVFEVGRSTSRYNAQADSTFDDGWHHIAVTYNSTSGVVNFYLDGVYDGEGNVGSYEGHYARIAEAGYANVIPEEYNGNIDDVMVFSRILTSNEIAAIANSQSTNTYSRNFTGLGSGDHTFRAYAQDSDGNVSSTELRSVTIS